jgi:hypothetical protein
MGKIIAVLTLAAITPAWGDVAEITDPKSAVDFVLSTCLPAMDNLANVEKMAAENNWFHLPTVVFDSKYTTSHLRWRTNGYAVITWSFKGGNFPSCFIGIRPYRKVDRDGFWEAISATVELKPTSDRTSLPTAHQEMYEIVGERPLRLLILTIDGAVASTSIWWSPP